MRNRMRTLGNVFGLLTILLCFHLISAGNGKGYEINAPKIEDLKVDLHVIRSRVKRQVSRMTPDEAQAILDKHNQLRGLEYASDMMYMKWNDHLAATAQQWSDTCTWGHGFVDPQPAEHTGQNLYLTEAPYIDIIDAVQKWYDEVAFYNYQTTGCVPGEMCGHYTQIVWARSWELGCAVTKCGNVTNYPKPGIILACHYFPGGNYPGIKPFKRGEPCKQCPSGSNWCHDGLCDTCDLVCKNCAELNRDNCTCDCKGGWGGADCSQKISPNFYVCATPTTTTTATRTVTARESPGNAHSDPPSDASEIPVEIYAVGGACLALFSIALSIIACAAVQTSKSVGRGP